MKDSSRILISNWALAVGFATVVAFSATAVHFDARDREQRQQLESLSAEINNGQKQVAAQSVEIAAQRAELDAQKLELKFTKDQTRLYNAIISRGDSAIVAMDSNLRVIYWNKRAETIFGWTFSEMQGQPIDRLMWPEGQLKHTPAIVAAMKREVDSTIQLGGDKAPKKTQIVYCVGRTKSGGKPDLIITAGVAVDEYGKMPIAAIKLAKNVELHGLEPKKEP